MGNVGLVEEHKRRAYWLGQGALGVFSIPAAILLSSFIGFGVLCRETGLTLGQTMFMTGAIWALPSQVVLVGSIGTGTSLVATGLAVALSAVRFTPMVAAWVPLVRHEDTKRWKLLILSHFVAVTAWVFAFMRLPSLPRRVRLTYFAGFAMTLTVLSVGISGLSFSLSAAMPTIVAGALFFLTPIYFITALSRTASAAAERLALVLGMILGPVFFHFGLALDLLWAGLVGGTLAYLGGRFLKSRNSPQ